MGRTPIGAAARTETVTIRMTRTEKAELTKRFGTPGKALRTFVDTVMSNRTSSEDSK